MVNKIKVAFKILAIVAGALLFLGVLGVFDKRPGQKPLNLDLDVPVPIAEETYRPPIVKIPFITKDRQPVKTENLPIPKKDIDKTIVISKTGLDSITNHPITLVVDKGGKIYKTNDTPDDTQILITKWRERNIGFTFKIGGTLAYSDGFYYCFSLDVFRIGRFYAGGEFGLKLGKGEEPDFLLGLSGKYKFATLKVMDRDFLIFQAVCGWDFLHRATYFGLSVKW